MSMILCVSRCYETLHWSITGPLAVHIEAPIKQGCDFINYNHVHTVPLFYAEFANTISPSKLVSYVYRLHKLRSMQDRVVFICDNNYFKFGTSICLFLGTLASSFLVHRYLYSFYRPMPPLSQSPRFNIESGTLTVCNFCCSGREQQSSFQQRVSPETSGMPRFSQCHGTVVSIGTQTKQKPKSCIQANNLNCNSRLNITYSFAPHVTSENMSKLLVCGKRRLVTKLEKKQAQ